MANHYIYRHDARMRRAATAVLCLGLLGNACADGAVGPIGPGGRPTVFVVEGPGLDPEAVDAFVRVPDARAPEQVEVVLEATVPGPNPPARGRLALTLGLDLAQIRQLSAPRQLEVARSTAFAPSADGEVAWEAPGEGALRLVRLSGPCTTCAVEPGTQRLDGWVRVLFLGEGRIELGLELDVTGSTPTDPLDGPLRLEAFADLALPARR